MRRLWIRWLCSCFLVGLLMGCSPPPEIQVLDARVRGLLPGMDKTVGYFSLQNNTGEALELVAITAPRIGSIEIHETVETEGMLRMRRVPSVRIESNQRVVFEPGGKHLMLFDVTVLDDPVAVVLNFENHPDLTINLHKMHAVP